MRYGNMGHHNESHHDPDMIRGPIGLQHELRGRQPRSMTGLYLRDRLMGHRSLTGMHLRDRMTGHPWAAAALGIGAGFLVARFLKSRSEHEDYDYMMSSGWSEGYGQHLGTSGEMRSQGFSGIGTAGTMAGGTMGETWGSGTDIAQNSDTSRSDTIHSDMGLSSDIGRSDELGLAGGLDTGFGSDIGASLDRDTSMDTTSMDAGPLETRTEDSGLDDMGIGASSLTGEPDLTVNARTSPHQMGESHIEDIPLSGIEPETSLGSGLPGDESGSLSVDVDPRAAAGGGEDPSTGMLDTTSDTSQGQISSSFSGGGSAGSYSGSSSSKHDGSLTGGRSTLASESMSQDELHADGDTEIDAATLTGHTASGKSAKDSAEVFKDKDSV